MRPRWPPTRCLARSRQQLWSGGPPRSTRCDVFDSRRSLPSAAQLAVQVASGLYVQEEGSLWRAVGVLTAAGALRNAVLLLRRQGLPDCAAAYVEAATAAGFGTVLPASDAGATDHGIIIIRWLRSGDAESHVLGAHTAGLGVGEAPESGQPLVISSGGAK